MKSFYSLFLLVLFVSGNSFAQQSKTIDQKPVVAGSFYSADAKLLKSQLDDFFKEAKPSLAGEKTVRAIIVPHAGYVYSGKVAASGFNQIDPAKKYKRVFVLATSHRTQFEGASIYRRGDFITPLGRVEVDKELASKLIKENNFFADNPAAYAQDHVLDVQLPFLKHKFGDALRIVPVMIGTQSTAVCKKMAAAFRPYFNDENLFVISSDFSHYPSFSDARKVDQETALSIISNSPDKFMATLKQTESGNIPGLATSCCSWPGVVTLLYMSSQEEGIELKLVDYRNSGESVYGDRSSVVGYNAIAVFKAGMVKSAEQGFSIQNSDKTELLSLARTTITRFLKSNRLPVAAASDFPETLNTPCGAFVTLKKHGELRGCVGNFSSSQPLYRVVQDMALAAAFQDTRFTPVKLAEMNEIEVEISVLTPLKPIKSADEFILGKHGIYMVSGSRNGTFLPQVADETSWTKEEFLGHCARDKAGIGWEGWKTAQLYTYEAIVFSEAQFTKMENK